MNEEAELILKKLKIVSESEELGITDEEGVILGYSGKMVMKVDKE